MLIEIGHFSVILALVLAIIQSTIPLMGAQTGRGAWMNLARPAAQAHFLCILIGFVALLNGFLVNDFSVRYIANNANSALPWYFRLSALWGAHEGSLLLWTLILSFWTLLVSLFSQSLAKDFVARVLAIMGAISVGFLILLLFTSNPFLRLIPAAVDGHDLNPLLQDFGLIIHPPMLYMGYVGFSVAFSFAIAALLSNRLDASWARWSRPWTLAAWSFLSLGIGLGSWWAYYELGWGGWWFWDPVENASFMPWLIGTALIHSLATSEKRGALKNWTVLLAIAAFSLSLLGTFLVRSGVLTSVHAFATDPVRGVAILIFLTVVIGGSLLLYALRAYHFQSISRFELLSKETFLVCNNIILVVLTSIVLLGTLYPLILDTLKLGKVSVGPPYFDMLTVPLFLLLALLLGFGTLVNWKSDQPSRVIQKIGFTIHMVALTLIIILSLFMHFSIATILGISCAVWILITSGMLLKDRLRNRKNKLTALLQQPLSIYGMLLAHIGFAMCIAGVTLVKTLEVENDLRMSPTQRYQLAGHEFHFNGMTTGDGTNYRYIRGHFDIYHNNQLIAQLKPEKRTYPIQRSTMTEAAIDPGFLRDIYISLGEPLSKDNDINKDWSVRIYYKPFVRWIWLGALLMFFAGMVSICDKRYQFRKIHQSSNQHATVTT